MKKTKKTRIRTQLQNWSKAVRERDGNKCVICGSTEHVQAHHLMPKKFWKDYRFELNNGISLCAKHHSFGRWSIHRGVGDYALFCWLKENRPEQWKWYTSTLLNESGKESWRAFWEKRYGDSIIIRHEDKETCQDQPKEQN